MVSAYFSETLYSHAILAASIFYTMGVAAVYMLRKKRPEKPRPYRMWMSLYPMAVRGDFRLVYIANASITQPRPSLMAPVIVASGVGAYRVWAKPAQERVFAP